MKVDTITREEFEGMTTHKITATYTDENTGLQAQLQGYFFRESEDGEERFRMLVPPRLLKLFFPKEAEQGLWGVFDVIYPEAKGPTPGYTRIKEASFAYFARVERRKA